VDVIYGYERNNLSLERDIYPSLSLHENPPKYLSPRTAGEFQRRYACMQHRAIIPFFFCLLRDISPFFLSFFLRFTFLD
jgi:hypothetical protein